MARRIMSRTVRTRPRIAMLGAKHFLLRRGGGIEVVVHELTTRMAARGYEVTCYNRTGCDDGSTEEKAVVAQKVYRGVRVKYAPTIHSKGLAAVSSSVFAALCTAFGDYDVVHFHAEGPCAMLWLPKLRGKRCIATIHALDHQRSEKWGSFARAYLLFGERVAARCADEVIVLSENAQAYFKNTYDRETVFIPNGAARPQIYDAELICERFGLQKDAYILFVGRLVPEKGLRILLEAFSQVKTDKRLVLAGGASDSEAFVRELRAMAKDDERVLFTDFVQGQVLAELYSNAYAFVLPSNVEGMPLSLLEAMSYGNCCLTSDIPECAEVVEDHAITFPKGSAEELKEKLQMLCDSPRLVEGYRTGAADFICAKYNWDEVVEKTLELYE